MSKTKKYYWLKLREDFFDDPQDETIQYITEQNPLYTIFYLKLCLKALRTDGKMLRYIGSKCLPYDVDSLAKLTNMDKDTVRCALALFKEIGLVRFLDSGELFLTQIDEMVGSETEEAIRSRKRRSRQALTTDTVPELPGQCAVNDRLVTAEQPPEKEIEKELEIEKETEKETRDRDRVRDREKKDLFETLLPSYQISEPLADKIREYLRYRKQQHRFTFQEVSLNAFLKKAEKAEQQYGSSAVMSCFDKTISNGWKGVFYESLPKPDKPKEKSFLEQLQNKYGRNNEEI
jgi:predicted phage replisome organizer